MMNEQILTEYKSATGEKVTQLGGITWDNNVLTRIEKTSISQVDTLNNDLSNLLKQGTVLDKVTKLGEIRADEMFGRYEESHQKIIDFAMRPDLDSVESYIFKAVRKCIADNWFTDACSTAIDAIRKHYKEVYSVNWDNVDAKIRAQAKQEPSRYPCGCH